MLVALASFSLMAVAAKELSVSLGTAQILFFRSVIGLLLILVFVSVRGWGFGRFKTRCFKRHLFRNLAHFVGQYGWIYGLGFIPLAEVFALEFTVPIWTALAATLLLNERMSKSRVIAIALGLVGVLIILRPTMLIIHPAALAVLVSAVAFGLSHTLTRSLVQQDAPLAIIFYMCLIQLPIALGLSLGNWQMPTGNLWLWLLLIGTTAMSAHYSVSKALSYADAMVVIPMDFLRLPLIMLVGFFFYNESIDGFLLLGAALMLLGNYWSLKRERPGGAAR
ncbi:MAG: DMT family transporter [Porticoccaceae bacterium]|nr:DMT family transporter [Porticoccaceae bacterium]